MAIDNGVATEEPLEDGLSADDAAEVYEAADRLSEDYFPVEYSITSYGADYPVDGLVKRIEAGSIYIPKFQRSYVWNIYRASRFVESLLLGLPVPAVFLSKELDSNKLLVIDGQQRLKTLQFFYSGIFGPTGNAFKLKEVVPRFKDLTYKTLKEDDRIRLDDSILHAIIVKPEDPKEEDASKKNPTSVYHIFERLNTGGVSLLPQEIRACIFHGPFIEFLNALNQDVNWRNLFGKVSARMRDQELILRFFALYFDLDNYQKPMKEFLTNFTNDNKRAEEIKLTRMRKVFADVTKTILEEFGTKALKPLKTVNAAQCDSIMYGVAKRLDQGPISDKTELKRKYEELMANAEFKTWISAGTTDENNVRSRLKLAREAFKEVP
jgi:uncharacterized protein with ParB-like and HNH nuclease domain